MGTMGLPGAHRGRPRSEGADRAILEAAAALLAERGLARMSIEEVAARAGVAKTTVYRRWTSKGAVALDAFVTRYLALQPLPDTGNLRGDLLKALRNWRRAVSDPLIARSRASSPRSKGTPCWPWPGRCGWCSPSVTSGGGCSSGPWTAGRSTPEQTWRWPWTSCSGLGTIASSTGTFRLRTGSPAQWWMRFSWGSAPALDRPAGMLRSQLSFGPTDPQEGGGRCPPSPLMTS